ncbi:MAG: hypothetical protein WD468_03390 [Pirellulales bacterium]
MLQFIFWLTVFFLIAGGWLVWSFVRRTLFSRRVERVLRDFVRDRDEIQAEFLKAAGASGKPRGLAWKQCDFQDGLRLARDRATGEIVGLVGTTISFAAIEGGGMEEVEAVGNLRAATAVLTWKYGRWTSQGRAVFNLEPREVLDRYRDHLDPI